MSDVRDYDDEVVEYDGTRRRHIFGIPDIPSDQPSDFTLDDDPESIVEMLSLFHPQVQNANMSVEENGDLRFAFQAGDKGI